MIGEQEDTLSLAKLQEMGRAALKRDPEAFAAALARVLDDWTLQQELREKGLSRVGELSWPRAARETLAVYREVG